MPTCDRIRRLWKARRLLLAGALAVTCLAEARKPDILLILADDLGWRDLGCYGGDLYATPAIDALARKGMRFTQAYAGAPVCTPARAALITGLHAARLHVTGQPGYKTEDTSARKFAHPDFRTRFPTHTPSITRTLADAGYRTALLGKWGFEDSPRLHGFEQVIDGDDSALVDASLALFAEKDRPPLFAYLNYSRPHVPLHPDPARTTEYASRPPFADGRLNPAYAAELEAMDHETGRLLNGLDRLGLTGETVVIFTSDNGGFLGYDDERIARNTPLREGKASLYEGGIRVPLIVRWPGVAPRDSISDIPVHGVDWHATLASIAGTATPPGLDGWSFAPVLRGTAMPRGDRALFWHYPHYRRSMSGLSASPSSAVRAGDWKLLHFYETDQIELYDLRNDMGESRDVVALNPARTEELRRRLEDWRSAVGAQPPVHNPPR